MKFGDAMRLNIAAATLCAGLVGCAPASVKDVVADKFGYLDSEFSNDKMSQSASTALAKLDQTPVGFHKLVLTVDQQVESQTNPNYKPVVQETFTLINAGNGLVRGLDEKAQNGIPVNQEYGLSYRNILSLRSQQVLLNSTTSNFVIEVKSLSRMDSPAPAAGGGSFEFDGDRGRTMQIANFWSWKRTCTWGAVHPASDLSAKFSGNVQDIDCQDLNQNGIQTNRVSGVYLYNYGVFVYTQIQTATLKSTFKFTDVRIE